MNIVYKFTDLELDEKGYKSVRPDWYSKFRCFDSLLNSVRASNVNYCWHIIHDGPKGKLYDYIESKELVESITNIQTGSGPGTLEYCYDYIWNISGNFYFVEDDYLHTENAIKIIKEGIDKFGLVTGYDHTDRYTRTDDICLGQEEIALTDSCYWRTAESTTCTWACNQDMWFKIRDRAKSYLFDDRDFFRNLYNDGIRLWTPMPAVSCHMNKDQLSPFVDWKNL